MPIAGETGMEKRLGILITLIILVVMCSGCDLYDAVSAGSSQKGSSGDVLFQDDFSDPNSGWRVWESPEASIAYENGKLRFLVNEPNYDYWSLAGQRYGDVILAVEAGLVEGPADNDFGIICRFKDAYNFYAFLISGDGYGGIVKMKEGLFQVLNTQKSLEYGTMIQQGYSNNQLRADCIGNRLTFYINQEKFLEVEDSDFLVGDVGLLVGTYDHPGVDVRFSNFFAIKP
jgi:hypothetical protein